MNKELLDKLICLSCGKYPLSEVNNQLICSACNQVFPVKKGIPDFLSACLIGKIHWKEEEVDPDKYEGTNVPNPFAFGGGRLDEPLLRYVKGDVLEIGCGTCRLAPQVEDRGGRYFGLDPLLPFLAFAREKRGLETLVKGQGEKLPFKDNSFDCVIAGYYAYSNVNPAFGLPEVHRVLKKNGFFAFLIKNYWGLTLYWCLRNVVLIKQWERILSIILHPNLILHPNFLPEIFQFTSTRQLKKIARDAGLVLEKVMSTPIVPYKTKLLMSKYKVNFYYKNFLVYLGDDVIVVLKSA